MSEHAPSVTVLVSAGVNPTSGAARACRGDAVALALAKKLACGEVRVVHAGKPDDPALQDYLALGAHSIDVIAVPDARGFVSAIAAAVANADLVVTGVRAESGAGSGLLPYTLAHALARPIAANLLEASISNGQLLARQFLPRGKRRMVSLPTRAVVTVHPLAPVSLTYAYARRRFGNIRSEKVPESLAVPDLGQFEWTLEKVARRPIKLKAAETRSAHARLHSLIAAPAKGGRVVIEGTNVDKAQVLLDYLREHRLVDF